MEPGSFFPHSGPCRSFTDPFRLISPRPTVLYCATCRPVICPRIRSRLVAGLPTRLFHQFLFGLGLSRLVDAMHSHYARNALMVMRHMHALGIVASPVY